jgi:putative ABC transport system permease protein
MKNNPRPQPPRWATRLLHTFCASHLVEELEGDLDELFSQRLQQMGVRNARLRYVRDVLSLIRPFAMKRKSSEYSPPSILNPLMLRNYFIITWRNLTRSKSFSTINIFGLAVGMTCCMLLLLYIQNELSFDRHHRHANDLYLVGTEAMYAAGNQEKIPRQSSLYAPTLKAEYPEIEQSTRLWINFIESKSLLQVQEQGKPLQSFYETKGYQVDDTFFDLFSYQFTEGDSRTALRDAHSVVLSEETARKLYGNAPALNKIIRINGVMGNGENFRVTGVFRDESARSHIDARFLMPMSAGWVGNFLRDQPQNFHYSNMFYTYVRLRPGTDPRQLDRKLPAFIEKYARKGLKTAGFDKRIFLIPVPDLHLYDQLREVVTPTNSHTYLYILASIALFTLLIACINFMNLATARATKRAKEVGIRKVLGAGRGGLIQQFLSESMVLTFIALLVALGMVGLLLPEFNHLTGKNLAFSTLIEPGTVAAFLILALLTGLLAGSYPALYLSVFNPVEVLKGRFTNSISVLALRRVLVVFQFVVSIALVLSTLVIGQQMQFLRNQPLGFNKDQQVVIPLRSDESHAAFTTLRNEIRRNNQVIGVAGTHYYPGIINPMDMSLRRPDQHTSDIKSVKTNVVDADFMGVMGFELIKGRMFSTAFPGDTNNRLVVNEAALRHLEIPLEKAVGYRLHTGRDGGTNQVEIIGVVRDFHFEDLHQPIQPYAFLLNNTPYFNYLIVHVNTDRTGQVIASLEQTWKAIRPDEPFEYTFLDEDFQRNYQADVRVSRLVSYFTVISILISCLGLFGLAAFAAQQRTKEIGIRKVLGAGVSDIVNLLSRDFLKLVLIAVVVASPIAWWVMNRWLDEFAYKIGMEWWMFALAGLLALGITLLTVGFQSMKVALMNPVKSLRAE